MMQFTTTTATATHESPSSTSPLLFPPILCNNLPIMNKTQPGRGRPWPGFPTSKALGSFGDANCMEQLLVHCANAIEANDVTLAQQILWVLNNIAPPDGDSNQRLTSAFLSALISRAARTGGSCIKMLASTFTRPMIPVQPQNDIDLDVRFHVGALPHRFSVIDFATFIDLTPWHRFGFTAANAAILEAVEGFSVVHVVDLSSTHCMQIPTLVDAIASRHYEVPPLIKLTVAAETDDVVPPILDISYDELGLRLVNFARSRNIMLEFRVVPSTSSDGFACLIDHLRVQHLVNYPETTEALVINCHMMLHYIPEETLNDVSLHATTTTTTTTTTPPTTTTSSTSTCSLRSMFLKSIRSLDPNVVVLVDEDADLTSNNLVCRLRSAFNFLWIPYDTVDTFLPKGSKQRQWYEADICWKIENVIANEGAQRVERLEPKSKWVQRMRNANFRSVGFGEDAVSEVKSMLDEHAAGWGLKKEDEDHLVLTWKGHNVVFATVWMPA
ncbi:GRAS transcription factor [Parasponia andersonii]|uniref:GRAS transcription factor n=1 Tax=Parasponia andersonii TaxID=3476 RepID=A0A2P5D0C0_PARAD|nr:GRAS transcription factor [Parasponia andersonii]